MTAGNVGDAQAGDDLLAGDLTESDLPADKRAAGRGRAGRRGRRRASVGYGDAAYGAGALLETLEGADAEINCKVQPPVAPGGRYAKDAFQIDLDSGTVTGFGEHRNEKSR